MWKLTPFLLFGCIVLTMVSCEKEKSLDTLGHHPGTAGAGSEIGTWTFLSMNAVTNVTISYTSGADKIMTVTTSDYTSTDNAGTITFDGKNITTAGVTYAVDGLATTKFYTNNVLENTFEFPFGGIIPATNSTVPYQKIGRDSLHFSSDVLTGIAPNGAPITVPTGYKLKFEGDKMMITMVYNDTKLQVVSGITQRFTSHAVTTATLQKQ
ncbi:hypothetical protein [Longitalea arenae]|uniref:hypothetical protein n=1 Tax=Longitalea arenae TaxID=2812558 RepID=UPI0019672558|nr:hypothetical protein [Longitalea arenae]